jgi:signal transduction histidine kinase
MFAATVQAAITLLLATALAAYVALRPVRTPLRTPLLALLGSLLAWSAGVIWRFSAASDEAAYTGLVFSWIGISTLPPLWLLLGARYARVPILEARPLVAIAAFLPSVLTFLAVATNQRHHLFFRDFVQAHTERGPLFYAYLGWGYPCVLAGVALFLVAARRMWSREAWGRGLLTASAAILPTLASAVFVFGWLPFAYDPTPAVLGLSLLLLTVGIFRYQLLDALPLAWRDVIDHLRDGVLLADKEGLVLDANPAAMRILRRGLAAIRGRRLVEILAAPAADAAQGEALAAAFEALAPDATLPPTEVLTPDDRWVEITAKCLRDADAGTVGRFAVLRDRTEERRYERLVGQSQKLETVGSLAAGIAHEVNNPLAFVSANLGHLARLADLVARSLPAQTDAAQQDLAELPQVVAECIDGVERIGRIVDSMRRFSRVSSDEFAPVDLNRVVTEAIRLAELHPNRGVTVEAWLAEGLPRLQGSAQRLTQVFLNLLVNSKQALAGRAGRVTLRTRLVGEMVEVMVSDDGPGVPEGLRHRIFDPFFTTKGPDEGTGLGLSIAFDIVREHGGVLELRPVAGGGACFIAHLPVHSEVDALSASARAAH